MGRSTLLKLFLVPACVHIYMCVGGGGEGGEAELVSEMNKSRSKWKCTEYGIIHNFREAVLSKSDYVFVKHYVVKFSG